MSQENDNKVQPSAGDSASAMESRTAPAHAAAAQSVSEPAHAAASTQRAGAHAALSFGKSIQTLIDALGELKAAYGADSKKKSDYEDINAAQNAVTAAMSTAQSTEGAWICPQDGTRVEVGNFCPMCGSKRPAAGGGAWICPQDGTRVEVGNFCPMCGGKRPAPIGGTTTEAIPVASAATAGAHAAHAVAESAKPAAAHAAHATAQSTESHAAPEKPAKPKKVKKEKNKQKSFRGVNAKGSAFKKDFFRSISTSLGRFLAIAAIAALGTGFYAGLRMTCPDMKISADNYYDDTYLMDIRVVSTLGMSDADIAALGEIEGVEAVMPARETDVVMQVNGDQYTTRIHSLHKDAASLSTTVDSNGNLSSQTSTDQNANTATVVSSSSSKTNAYVNRLVLDEGRWPQAAGECVISADKVMSNPTAIGDVITVTECTSDVDSVLKTSTYTIVGFVHSSYYVCTTAMGTTSLGGGSIETFMYVLDDSFADDYPITEAFITVQGAREYSTFSDEYTACVAAVQDRINAIAPARAQARSAEVRSENQAEIDKGWSEYYAAEALAQSSLSAAAEQLAQAESEVLKGRESYESGVAEYQEGVSSLEESRASVEAELAQQTAKLESARQQLEAAYEQLKAAWDESGLTPETAPTIASVLDTLSESTKALCESIQAAIDKLDPSDPFYDIRLEALRLQLSLSQALDETISGSAEDVHSLINAQGLYDEQQEIYQQGAADLEAARKTAEEKFAEAQAQLDAAAQTLAEARAELESGSAQLASGKAEYATSKASAEQQLADARLKLEEAQSQLDSISDAQWYVLDRTKNYGYESYKADAGRIDSIAAVFPLIFFLVAALVSLTTMTRMIEEERVLIGTYKALGYSRMKITARYLLYAGLACLIGSIIGILILSQVLPLVIEVAYSIIYAVYTGPFVIDVPIALSATLLGLGIVLIATWAAAAAALAEKPATLMLPRAPAAGKRILLERIGFIWKHMSFSWKITFRNLFRYKKRLVMTVIGIAGCTALLLTGLGLQNAINGIIDNQYGRIIQYNTTINIDAEKQQSAEAAAAAAGTACTTGPRAELEALYASQPEVTDYTWAYSFDMLASPADAADMQVDVVVPENPSQFSNFIAMQNRLSGEKITLSDSGVVVTEKLATVMGIEVGDTLRLYESDTQGNITSVSYDVPVAAIMENYVYNSVYITPTLYKSIWGKTCTSAESYVKLGLEGSDRLVFSDAARTIDGVKTVHYNDETIEAYRSMIESVNLIVVVLVIAAAALAFIVLYNLTNINICERQREIATLKVLGFTRGECNAYIFREIVLLAILGAALGLVLGIFLEGFVVTTAEVNQVMFGRDIAPMSFVLAFVITMLFAVLVMFAMRGKLAKVNMVESLKSVE